MCGAGVIMNESSIKQQSQSGISRVIFLYDLCDFNSLLQYYMVLWISQFLLADNLQEIGTVDRRCV